MGITKRSRDFPYVFHIPKKKNQWEVDEWCKEHFGERWSAVDYRNGRWACFWAGHQHPGHYEWLFKNEQDALLFALRWS